VALGLTAGIAIGYLAFSDWKLKFTCRNQHDVEDNRKTSASAKISVKGSNDSEITKKDEFASDDDDDFYFNACKCTKQFLSYTMLAY